jgi:hypothetical protein
VLYTVEPRALYSCIAVYLLYTCSCMLLYTSGVEARICEDVVYSGKQHVESAVWEQASMAKAVRPPYPCIPELGNGPTVRRSPMYP